jgi:hypothetical protein
VGSPAPVYRLLNPLSLAAGQLAVFSDGTLMSRQFLRDDAQFHHLDAANHRDVGFDSNLFSNKHPVKIVDAREGRFLKGDDDITLCQAALSSRPVWLNPGDQYTLVIG